MFATTKTRRLKIAGKPHEKQFEKTSLRKFIGIPAFSNKYLYIYIYLFLNFHFQELLLALPVLKRRKTQGNGEKDPTERRRN